MARYPESKQLTRAIRRHSTQAVARQAQKMLKARVVVDEPLTVELIGSGLRLDDDHLLLGSWLRYYDDRHGIVVGDTLIVTHLDDTDGNWFVTDVISDNDWDLADHPEDGDYDPYAGVMGQVTGQIPYRDEDGSDIGVVLTYDPDNLTAPVVNGKWIKGVAGAAVWAPIAAADIGGANLVGFARNLPGLAGPWPQSWTINVPVKSDVLLVNTCSLYTSTPGMCGFGVNWDGARLPVWGDYFFNESGSHKQLIAVNVVNGAASGNHTVQVVHAYGAASSDSNDRATMGVSMVAVP